MMETMDSDSEQETAVLPYPVSLNVSARATAIAWLNAFLATSDEESRPVLYQTLGLEFFENGLQLIGCDGTMLFRTWVPRELHPDEEPRKFHYDWPVGGEWMDRSIVMMDPDGFAKGFMSALLRVTGEDEHANEVLHISTSACDDEATVALGPEFMTERLTLRACGQRIDLRVLEGPYIDWRSVKLGMEEAERVDGLTIASRVFATVGKLRGVRGVDLEFFGESKHVAFVAHGEVAVRGLLMPMRREAKKDVDDEPPAKSKAQMSIDENIEKLRESGASVSVNGVDVPLEDFPNAVAASIKAGRKRK